MSGCIESLGLHPLLMLKSAIRDSAYEMPWRPTLISQESFERDHLFLGHFLPLKNPFPALSELSI